MSYKEYIRTVYNCPFIISDNGTGQEEPALVGTPVVVPRDFTERPQSYTHNCSIRLDLENDNYSEVFDWIESIKKGERVMNTEWLGKGETSTLIVNHISNYFKNC